MDNSNKNTIRKALFRNIDISELQNLHVQIKNETNRLHRVQTDQIFDLDLTSEHAILFSMRVAYKVCK